MKDDYAYLDESGNRTAIRKLTVSQIQEFLQEGVSIKDKSDDVSPSDIMDRLRVELEIRRIEGKL